MSPSPSAGGVRVGADAGQAEGRALIAAGGEARALADVLTRRRDAVEVARGLTAYREAAATELRRLDDEGDLSKPETAETYRAFLNDTSSQLLRDFPGSGGGRAALAAQLEGLGGSYRDQQAVASLAASHEVVRRQLDGELQVLTARALNEPGASLDDLFTAADAQVDLLAAGMNPQTEQLYRDSARQQITESRIEGLLGQGAWREARDLVLDTPDVLELMTPAKQREFAGRIARFEQAETDARNEGLRRVQAAEAIKGAPLTLAERVQLAGLAPPTGRQTLADKITEAEAVLGPLTPEQRQRLAGLDPAQAQTKAGQIVQDRELFVREFGAASPQVAAFDELAAGADEPPSLSDEGGIRKEFTRLSGEFTAVRDSFGRMVAAGQDPSPAGDLAIAFNYMKMLDPGSVVRESEFATVAATGSFGTRLQAAAQRFLRGERLTDEQRADFLSRSEDLMRVQLRTQLLLEDQFRGIADRARVNADNVVVDFVGPYREGGALQVAPQVETAGAPVRLQFDLQGNPLGAAGQEEEGE